MVTSQPNIAENIQRVQESIAVACARAGRDVNDVTLIAVSKTHPASLVLEALTAGIRHFGENRVEEADSKIPAVLAQTAQRPIWHMIGHVQSRKAKLVTPLFDVVHSVDSLKLAEKFSALAVEQGKTLDILLEMNISGEDQKDGFPATGWQHPSVVRDTVWQFVQAALELPGLRVRGLMTMAPFYDDGEQARPVFAELAHLRAELNAAFKTPLPDLSMGMTNDFVPALEEGATIIRIGRAIFGERQ
jgi:PLP dependent protein